MRLSDVPTFLGTRISGRREGPWNASNYHATDVLQNNEESTFLVVFETHCLQQRNSMQQRAFTPLAKPFQRPSERPRTTQPEAIDAGVAPGES